MLFEERGLLMTNLIRGKVARILNARELVLNCGTSDFVTIGKRFAVLDPAGEEIIDPDSGQRLGSLQRPKVLVEVTQVGPHMSVAKTFRFSEVNVGGEGTNIAGLGEFARMFAPPRMVKRYETLKAADATWEPLSEEDSIVKVGDPVVEIRDEDEEVAGVIGDE